MLMHQVLLYRKMTFMGHGGRRGSRGQPQYKFVLLLRLTAEILQALSEKKELDLKIQPHLRPMLPVFIDIHISSTLYQFV